MKKNIINMLCLVFKYKNNSCPKEPKSKYQLKRNCALPEHFCKSKFRQLCINYRDPHLWNTIVLGQNTDSEQSTTLKILKKN